MNFMHVCFWPKADIKSESFRMERRKTVSNKIAIQNTAYRHRGMNS